MCKYKMPEKFIDSREQLSREISKIPEKSAQFKSHPKCPKEGRSKAQPIDQSQLSEAV